MHRFLLIILVAVAACPPDVPECDDTPDCPQPRTCNADGLCIDPNATEGEGEGDTGEGEGEVDIGEGEGEGQ